MESHLKIAVQKLMAQVLEQLGNQPACWWYSLNGSKDNESNSACLFDVQYENRFLIFVICGYLVGANGSRFKANAFNDFKIQRRQSTRATTTITRTKRVRAFLQHDPFNEKTNLLIGQAPPRHRSSQRKEFHRRPCKKQTCSVKLRQGQ